MIIFLFIQINRLLLPARGMKNRSRKSHEFKKVKVININDLNIESLVIILSFLDTHELCSIEKGTLIVENKKVFAPYNYQ